MGDGVVLRQGLLQGVRVNGAIFRRFQKARGPAQVATHFGDAAAISAVRQVEQFALPRQLIRQHGFHRERAAALQGNAQVGRPGIAQGQQGLANPPVQFDELGIPRATIAQHGLLDGGGGGQRAWGQQQGTRVRRPIGLISVHARMIY